MYLTRKKIKLVISWLVIVCVVGITLYIVLSTTSAPVNLVNVRLTAKASLLSKKKPLACPVVHLAGVTYPRCIFSKHEYTTESASEANYERVNVGAIARLLRHLRTVSKDRDAVFVDLGTDIGTYSLPVLHNGVKVLSVDADWEAIRRFTVSLYLANLTDTQRITVLHNAVTSQSGSLLDLRVSRKTRRSIVVHNGVCVTTSEYKCKKDAVRSIRLDDVTRLVADKSSRKRRPLVVIKADIEGNEPMIFTEKSAAKFFQDANVVLVQMELEKLSKNLNATRLKKDMLEFFADREYYIRSASLPGHRLKLSQCLSMSGNVWFIKKRYEDKLLNWLRG